MNKTDFLKNVKEAMPPVPLKNMTRALSFLGKRIDSRIRDAASEEAAIEDLGSVERFAKLATACVPLYSILKARVLPKRKLRTAERILVAVTSPLWLLGLLLAELLMLGLCAAVCFVAFAVYAVDLMAAVCFVLSLVSVPLDVIRGGYLKGALALLVCAACAFLTLLFFAASIGISKKVGQWCVCLNAAIKTKLTKRSS